MENKRLSFMKDTSFDIRILELCEVSAKTDLNDFQERICLHISNFAENGLSLELLTFGVPNQNQKIKDCNLRSLVILREAKEDLSSQRSTIDIALRTVEGELRKAGFLIRNLTFNEYQEVSSLINSDSVIVNFRKEIHQSESNSIVPFISFDSISSLDSTSLFSALTQLPGCAISMQIIADNYTIHEKQMISQLYADYDSLHVGKSQQDAHRSYILAKYPKEQMGYYQSVGQGPMFRVNMIIIGEKSMAMQLNTVLRSAIMSTSNRLFQMESFMVNDKQSLLSNKKSLPYNISRQVEQYLTSHSAFANIKSTSILLKFAPKEVRSLLILPTESLVMGTMPVHLDSMMPDIMLTPSVFQDSNSICIGESKNYSVNIPWKSMCNNTAITGNIGTGKSNLVFKMILEARKLGINLLIIEPVKSEYRHLHSEIEEMKTFSAGNRTSPLIINVFIPPQGVELSQYRPLIAEIFRIAFDMTSPLDVIFERSLKKTYQKFHWKDYSTSEDPDVITFGFNEFLAVFKEQIQLSSYSVEIKGNLMSAGFYRFLSLIESDRDTFDCVNTIPTSEYTKGVTLLELNSIHSETQKVLIMTITLLGLVAFFKSNPNRKHARNLIFLDEAHVLLDSLTSSSGSLNTGELVYHIFMNMLAEFRALKVGVVVCDQMATRIGSKILALCDNKISFRQTEGTEVNILAECMQFDEGTRKCLTRLTPGQAIYKSAITKDIPILIRTQNISDHMSKLAPLQLENHMSRFYRENPSFYRPYHECNKVSECEGGCSHKIRSDASYIANMLIDDIRKPIESMETFLPYVNVLPKILAKTIEKYFSTDDSSKLKKCSSIQFIRAALLAHPMRSDPESVKRLIHATIMEVEIYERNKL